MKVTLLPDFLTMKRWLSLSELELVLCTHLANTVGLGWSACGTPAMRAGGAHTDHLQPPPLSTSSPLTSHLRSQSSLVPLHKHSFHSPLKPTFVLNLSP